METPVLFLIFTRTDTTQKVFEAIRKQKPKYLFVAADGPRSNKVDDAAKCRATRAIIDSVDWPCTVKTLYREQNLGCRAAVSSGIDWFFKHVEEGIVLEDDCLPHPDFFSFCEAMLEKYRDNPKVMHITGGNFQFGQKRGDASYYFSRIPHIWGWATWRRAWSMYDVDMNDYPKFVALPDRATFFYNKFSEAYWLFHFDRVYKKSGTWDYQWTYAVMKNKGHCIIPNKNLITNIGFGDQATHATEVENPAANLPLEDLGDILHPSSFTIAEEADLFTLTKAFPIPSLSERIIKKMKTLARKLTI